MQRFWTPADRESRFSRPGQSGALMPVRDLALSWVLLVLIAVLAWVITYQQARGMGIGPGTMGIALLPFLLLWVIMMAAMMLPSMAPVAVTWAKGIGRQSSGWAKAFRLTQFIGGYLLAWTAFGFVAYGGLALTGHLVNRYPDSGRWIGAAAFLLAGLYQLGPLKYICLRHCRDPISQLMKYANFPRPARDLRVGLHHGAYCVGCCWALMVVLIPLGVMNIPAVAALAAVIFLEKLWRYGPYLARLTGIVFLILAVLAPFQDWLLPGLRMTGGGM
jgi:predicted metal-binding membrane protein